MAALSVERVERHQQNRRSRHKSTRKSGHYVRSPEDTFEAEGAVIGRFGTAFRAESLDDLTAETVADFLRRSVNHHWRGLERNTPQIVADMPALREGMAVLLDESVPLAERWDAALPRMRGVGKAVASAMLLVTYPTQCCVWNGISGAQMAWMGLIPESWLPRSDGRTYKSINTTLLDLADQLDISLWHLDAVWRFIALERESSLREVGQDA